MALPHKIEQKLINFLNPKIVYNSTFSQYMFNDDWLIDITGDTFKEPVLNFLQEINNHLNVGADNKTFLKYLISKTEDKIDWINENNFLKINNIDELTSTLKTIENTSECSAPAKEKYTIDFLKNCSEEEANKIINENNYYADSFYFDGLKMTNYVNLFDFEKVKLRYVLQLYNEYLLIIYSYLDSILINNDSINFSEYDFSELLVECGLIETKKINSHFQRKCHVNFNKKETAQLFVFLMQEGFFSFDDRNRKNRTLLTNFIEANFTYNGDNNTRSIIKNINQNFSDLLYPNTNEQLPFINNLINILQIRKSSLE
jgi:hypothetical protein